MAKADKYKQQLIQKIADQWLENNKKILLESRSWGSSFKTTRRKNGSVVTNPRDIYDEGTLYNSLHVEVEGNVAKLKGAEHGLHVIVGSNGVPARNFPLLAAERLVREAD